MSSIRDCKVGIPWTGSGAERNAVFMLVREVSVRADMLKVIDISFPFKLFDDIIF